MLSKIMRDGAMAARWAHYPEIAVQIGFPQLLH